ncbi:MAG: N-acetyltransferase family protein [Kangiellaceae bacterium]|nr:N-acetyltransferase family protein [Kangiellaceae bacterium]
MVIRNVIEADASQIADIYNHYIENTIITFETAQVSSQEMANRIHETLAQSLPYLIIESDGQVLGYAYASKWKGRCAYRYSVEVTVYLSPTATGKGLGSRLYKELLNELKQLGYRTAIGGIALPNPASIALHEKMGMEKVAHFKQVGFKFDEWIDVGYWQVFL